MLQVTDRAASAFKEILAADDVAGEAIRLSPGTGPDAGGFDILAISEPDTGDVPTQAEGVVVFVAPELADVLDQLILDADDEGQAFFIRPQG